MSQGIETPRYIKIAVDVALRIYKGNFIEGDKLRGRSILASEYNVSPETIRKSMKLLEDMEVVSVNKGSGIVVKSKDKAFEFIESFKDKENIGILRSNIKKLLQQRKEIEKNIEGEYEKIIDHSYRFKNFNLIEPIEVIISSGCHLIGTSIGKSKFWHNTGATILGVKRNNKVNISPGPYWEFCENDIIIVVGDGSVLNRIDKYLSNR